MIPETQARWEIAESRAESAEGRVRELEAAALEAQGAEQDREQALSRAEALATEWQQTAREAQADLAVLRTEHEKLKLRVYKAIQRLAYDEELLPETRIDRALEALRG